MKIKKNMIYRKVADEHILVPTGDSVIKYGGVFVTSEVGAEIWNLLVREMDEEAIISSLLETYAIDEMTLRKDYAEFIEQLRLHELIEN